jgi:hypothetical protein
LEPCQCCFTVFATPDCRESKAAPAIPRLIKLLDNDDRWMRCALGDEIMFAAPALPLFFMGFAENQSGADCFS